MSFDELFPANNVYASANRASGIPITLTPCRRCCAWVAWRDRERHHRWHQAVDSGSTTLLPSDRAAGPETTAPVGGQANHSAPRSSGAGRPNPKDPR